MNLRDRRACRRRPNVGVIPRVVGLRVIGCNMLATAAFWCMTAVGAAADLGEGSNPNAASAGFQGVPDRGAVLYYQATMKLLAGANREAMQLLQQCLNLHEGFDPSGSPIFTPVMSHSADWSRRIAGVHREFPPVSRARLAFVTEERDLVPEGLAYDEGRDAFYLSSLNRRKIVRIAANGTTSDFVPDDRDHLLPVLGIRLDPNDGSVWAASWSEQLDRSELLHFDSTGTLLARHASPDGAKHGFNDLVVRRNGAVLLTDSLSNQVYQFDRSSHTFSALKLHRELNEPNGIALSEDNLRVYVADDFGVQQLNLSTGASSEVDPGPRSTLAGADGLYWHRGSLIAIQNAIGSPRIAQFKLSKDGTRVVRTTVLEYRSALLRGEPTTGAINDFYFMANSQADNMHGDQVVDPAKLEPIRIGMLRLP